MVRTSSREISRYIFIIIILKIKKLKTKKNDNSKNISRNFSGAVEGSVGSVKFQIVP